MSDRGFTVTQQKHLITAGNLKLDVELDAEGMPQMVHVNIGGGLTIGAEQLERAAAVIEQLRHETNDRSRVCPTHGYYENSTYPYSCAACKAAESESPEPVAAAS